MLIFKGRNILFTNAAILNSIRVQNLYKLQMGKTNFKL